MVQRRARGLSVTIRHVRHLSSKGGNEVDLQQPGVQVRVYHVVQPHQLEHCALPRDRSLRVNVSGSRAQVTIYRDPGLRTHRTGFSGCLGDLWESFGEHSSCGAPGDRNSHQVLAIRKRAKPPAMPSLRSDESVDPAARECQAATLLESISLKGLEFWHLNVIASFYAWSPWRRCGIAPRLACCAGQPPVSDLSNMYRPVGHHLHSWIASRVPMADLIPDFVPSIFTW